jgi:aspartate aminotransferase-like enzyme
MPGRNFLFVPGPTNVPDRVMRAMMVAMEDHRSSKFPELTLWLFQEMKKVFKTKNGHVFIFPCDLNDLMVLGALAGAEMAMRDVGIDVSLGSGVAAAQAHFRATVMAKERKPTEEERFAEIHPEGVVNA